MSSITAQELVRLARMSTRPEFYSGRGARSCDLNGEQLFTIHKNIKEKIGERQAEAFVTMVKSIKSLSATNFLNCLYSLEANGWEYHPMSEDDIDVGPDSPAREIIAFASIFEAMSPSHVDATDYIRNSFLRLIGAPSEEAQANCHWYDYT